MHAIAIPGNELSFHEIYAVILKVYEEIHYFALVWIKKKHFFSLKMRKEDVIYEEA